MFQNTRQPDWDWWEALWPEPKAVLKTVGIDSGQSVADVGSGNGYFTLPLAELVDGEPVYAIDINDELLGELAEAAAERQCQNIDCIHGDARNLPELLPEPVDTVLVANTFHGVEKQVEFARQARELLRPDGQFVVVNWHDMPKSETTVANEPRGPPESLRMAAEETRDVLRKVFGSVEQRDVPPYHYAVIGTRS
ncbi:methylase involved in ubiquinone/menaquinone biosynthesis [Halogeometricum borinquense DSM 11551]|uniref:Methylase involved in ubiquinone/menaquinone biosynthesis n=1 Tax=Halogeometricum borinquense (strain ATCC 700274 / DSM 11551 / JCM 10706 / KCTC 4070 / PR3) TaxID=469382 RepID=E4NMT3_HALBP|nr:class I SAM-dependent methyltransferase [Halogeometricum borinquense]ADQ66238.1 methylase involved in ubiquinone/menaquinone biosynthesis [Halogeometricum borinquense DSM 11551]ELY27267.1 methylase involved in ubiquinone/menaquinone biosynthesis [Halogeometricum borinquense DSM 11551]